MDATEISYEQFDLPEDVLKDGSLTRDQKIALLERWVADEDALARAAQEGLDGGEENHLQAATEALRKITEETTDSSDNTKDTTRRR